MVRIPDIRAIKAAVQSVQNKARKTQATASSSHRDRAPALSRAPNRFHRGGRSSVPPLRPASFQGIPGLQSEPGEGDSRIPVGPQNNALGYVGDPDQIQQLPVDPALETARALYEDWTDPATLEAHLGANPNLSEYSKVELQTLVAISIDQPDSHLLLEEAVVGTIEEAESLDDLPSDAEFQFLYERTVGDPPSGRRGATASAAGKVHRFVDQIVEEAFEGKLEGAKGDDDVDAALALYAEEVIDAASTWPAFVDRFDRTFVSTLEDNAEEIVSAQRADDPWWSRVNHAVTSGIRDLAVAAADSVAPPVPSQAGRIFGGGPIGQALNSENGVLLREIGIGVNHSFRGAIIGPAEAITDPVGTAEGFVEVVQNPSLLLEGYRQVAQESGPNAVIGAVGFDLLTVVVSAGGSSAAVGTSSLLRAGRLARVARMLPSSSLGSVELRIARRLQRNANFETLSSGVQNRALAHINKLMERSPTDARNLERVVGTEGFSRLDGDEQRRLLDLAGSNHPSFGGPTQARLAELQTSRAFINADAAGQERLLRATLEESSIAPDALASPGTYSPRVEFNLSEGARSPVNFESSDASQGFRFTVDLDGQSIEVYAPDGVPGLATPQQIAESLASLPPQARRGIQEVVIEPEGSPIDAANTNGQSTLATADINGTVRVYPALNQYPSDAFTDIIAHEAGHTVHNRELAPPTGARDPVTGETYNTFVGPQWERWQSAVDSDGVRPSQYATTDLGEDFAETYRLYINSMGTPLAAELRVLMPERFAIIDSFMNGAQS